MTFSGLMSRWTMPAAWARGQRAGNLAGDLDRRPRARRRCSITRPQRPPFDQLLDDVVIAGRRDPDLVDRDDVGMVERRGGAGFAEEAIDRAGAAARPGTILTATERPRRVSSPGTLRPCRRARATRRSGRARSACPARRPRWWLEVFENGDLGDLHVARGTAPRPGSPARDRSAGWRFIGGIGCTIGSE